VLAVVWCGVVWLGLTLYGSSWVNGALAITHDVSTALPSTRFSWVRRLKSQDEEDADERARGEVPLPPRLASRLLSSLGSPPWSRLLLCRCAVLCDGACVSGRQSPELPVLCASATTCQHPEHCLESGTGAHPLFASHFTLTCFSFVCLCSAAHASLCGTALYNNRIFY
jgi:hypothetical protein